MKVYIPMTLDRRGLLLFLLTTATATLVGCSTAPKSRDEAAFLDRTESTTRWFKANVDGLAEQIDRSEAYVIFPDVAQWGILIGGGAFGRGALYESDGDHIGWAAVNTGSIGLQAGVQGFRMLMVIEDAQTLNRFRANQLSGSMSGVAVLAEAGGSGTAPFKNGVVIYQGANAGLMAGINIGLDYIRHEPLDPARD